MKIVVTKEMYDEACVRIKEYLAQRDAYSTGVLYGQHCVFAVAAEKAGLDVRWVMPSMIKLKNGGKYVLPAAARQMLSEFDQSVAGKCEFPVDKLPAEFEIEEVASRED